MAEAIDELFVKLGLQTDQEQFQQAESNFSSLQSTVLQVGAAIGTGLGINELTAEWARGIDEMAKKAEVLEGSGVTPQFISQMQGAFALIRGDAEEAIPFIEQMVRLLEDVDWGEINDSALGRGLDLSGLQEAETAREAMEALQEQFQQMDDPQRQERLANAIGLSDDAFRLMKGGDIGPIMERAEELRPMTDEMVEAAKEFNEGWAELSRAMTSLTDRISESFVGELGSGMSEIADAIAENRKAIVDFANSAMPAINSIAVGIGTLVASRVGGGILGALKRSKIPGVPLLAAGAAFAYQTGGGVEEQREKLSAGEGESAVRDQMDARALMRGMPEELSTQAQRRWMQGDVETRREILQTNNITIQGTENPEATARAVNRELERAADNTREDTRSEAQ